MCSCELHPSQFLCYLPPYVDVEMNAMIAIAILPTPSSLYLRSIGYYLYLTLRQLS